MYPKDIWECNTGYHLASPLPHLSSLFLLAGGQENLSSCQHCYPSEPKQTHQQWQRNRMLHSEKSLVSSAKEASQQGICSWCPSHLWAQGPGVWYFWAASVQLWRWSMLRAAVPPLGVQVTSLPVPASCVGSLPQGGGTLHSDQVSTGTSSWFELNVV